MLSVLQSFCLLSGSDRANCAHQGRGPAENFQFLQPHNCCLQFSSWIVWRASNPGSIFYSKFPWVPPSSPCFSYRRTRGWQWAPDSPLRSHSRPLSARTPELSRARRWTPLAFWRAGADISWCTHPPDQSDTFDNSNGHSGRCLYFGYL